MRLAVVGSSHIGPLREAAETIAARIRGLEVRFFGLPGGMFRQCRMDGGVFVSRPRTPAEARTVRKINGADRIDLDEADLIWAVGYRFGYGAVLQGWIDGKEPEAKMRAEVATSVDHIVAQFGAEPRLVLSPAPYPALRTRAAGPHHEARMAKIQRHPERDAIFAAFEETITRMVGTAGYGIVLQPTHTRGSAFATDNDYLRGARDFETRERTEDLRHMNGAYGLALFEAFAAKYLADAPG